MKISFDGFVDGVRVNGSVRGIDYGLMEALAELKALPFERGMLDITMNKERVPVVSMRIEGITFSTLLTSDACKRLQTVAAKVLGRPVVM